jgi:hypothetical protein
VAAVYYEIATQVTADKARGSGNEYFHAVLLVVLKQKSVQ